MSAKPFRFLLPTGEAARIRPITPDDRERLREALARTSPRTLAARFGRARSAFTEDELAYFTRVDQRDHVAWCAVSDGVPGEPGIGSARFIRDREDPEAAEVAVTVLDEYQGMGIGTALLVVLYSIAIERGIRWLVGQVLADNHAVLRRLRRLGAEVAWNDVIYDFRLPVEPGGPPAAEPDSAERLREWLRAFERGVSPPAITKGAGDGP